MRRGFTAGVLLAASAIAACAAPATLYPQPAELPPTTHARTEAPPRSSTVGEPITDGSLRFTVHGLRRYSGAVKAARPAGEYLIVSLTVQNVGDAPVQYFTESQQLVIDGKQHPADILAAVYLSPQSADYIQPGLAIDIETPFDVPIGSLPEAVLLNEISEPSTAVVDLRGVRIA
ncbi:hypothetical protein A5721_22945 [Mycobacterium vulneris]|nr:hypothetical protein A5721_22945 [Mycolicibacterium vulneris]